LIYAFACLLSPLLRFGRVRRGRGVKMFIARDAIHADYLFRSELWSEFFGDHGEYVKIGWGDRKIFLETKTWGDLKALDVVSAFFGFNKTVMRVEFVDQIPSGSKEFDIDEIQFEHIKRHILQSRNSDAPLERSPSDYQGGDFYSSDLNYNCVTNCNNWVNRGMFLARVTNRLWCPISIFI
jgi:hypothetical protein